MPSLSIERIVLGRVLLVAALIISVLAMHGLSTPVPTSHHDGGDLGVTAITGEAGSHDTGHDALAHVGAICLWLITAGAAFVAALRFLNGRRLQAPLTVVSSGRVAPGRARRGRPPDRPTAGTLLC